MIGAEPFQPTQGAPPTAGPAPRAGRGPMPAILRGALIGCGFFATNHLHAWTEIPGVEIVALCDSDAARLASAGESFGIARRYGDAARLFASESLDFVDIATTVASHRALVELAARARVAVICQKPFAASRADAAAMVAACEAAGVKLMVHENFRWQTPVMAVREVIASGRIGTPFWGRVSFRSAFDVFSGQPYLALEERFIIADLGIHILDIARCLLGPVTSVAAHTQRINPAIKGEDVATMLLAHAGGATCIVDCSYATRLAAEPFPETMIDIDGAAGTLRLGPGYRLTVVDRNGAETAEVAPPMPAWATRPWHNIQDSVRNIQAHWVACLRSGQEPATSGRDNLHTIELVEAAYRSAALRQRLALPLGAG